MKKFKYSKTYIICNCLRLLFTPPKVLPKSKKQKKKSALNAVKFHLLTPRTQTNHLPGGCRRAKIVLQKIDTLKANKTKKKKQRTILYLQKRIFIIFISTYVSVYMYKVFLCPFLSSYATLNNSACKQSKDNKWKTNMYEIVLNIKNVIEISACSLKDFKLDAKTTITN